MAEVRLPDGRIVRFPDGMDPAAMGRAVQSLMAAGDSISQDTAGPPPWLVAPRVRPAETTGTDTGDANKLLSEMAMFGPEYVLPDSQARPTTWSDAGGFADDIVASGADGVRQGISAIAGLPVDAINASPMLLNLLPGEQGMTPISDNPTFGSQHIDELLRFGGVIDDYEPETMAGRFANRVGEELGATAVPVGVVAQIARGSGPISTTIRETPVGQLITPPMARQPRAVVGREALAAGSAGVGAQVGNEIQSSVLGGNNEGEGTWWSDLLGGTIGALTVPSIAASGRVLRNFAGAITGSTKHVQPEARERVADILARSSSQLLAQSAETGNRNVDTTALAEALRTPSLAEQRIPGFRANIADRVDDPGLARLAFNTDSSGISSPGQTILRQRTNIDAADRALRSFEPEGNPAQLREALQFGADARLAEADQGLTAARGAFDDAASQASPVMSPVVRGANIRERLGLTYEGAQQSVRDLFGQIDNSQPVEMGSLRDAFSERTADLPFNDRDRFLPSEVGTINRNIPDAEPVASSVLGPDGNPVMMSPAETVRPLQEALALRSGLSSDMRSPSITDQGRRVAGQYMEEIDDWLASALPPEQRTLYEQARAARLDVGRRFEDVGPIPDILNTSGRNQLFMPDEAVAPRSLRSQDDLSRVLAELGDDQVARTSLADQVLADAERANVTRNPRALAQFMTDRGFALEQFPEVRAALERAGTTRQQLAEAEEIAKQAQRQFAPGAPTPTGQYLRYGDENTRAAIATVWRSPRPADAAREILQVAGDTPETRQAARAALWTEVTSPTNAPYVPSATGGNFQWNGKSLHKLFNDDRFSAVADVLWEDNPQHLADLRQVVDALASAEVSTRTGRAANTSGTGQILGHDAALTAASIASTMRHMQRGQISPTIGIIDLAGRFLRRAGANVRETALRELLAEAVNDPNLAADLLIQHNPADAAALNQRFLSAYGARLPTLANAMAGEAGEDPLQTLAGDE